MSDQDENPKFGNHGVPGWIKVMWFLGVLWIIVYIISGLSNSPTTW